MRMPTVLTTSGHILVPVELVSRAGEYHVEVRLLYRKVLAAVDIQ